MATWVLGHLARVLTHIISPKQRVSRGLMFLRRHVERVAIIKHGGRNRFLAKMQQREEREADRRAKSATALFTCQARFKANVAALGVDYHAAMQEYQEALRTQQGCAVLGRSTVLLCEEYFQLGYSRLRPEATTLGIATEFVSVIMKIRSVPQQYQLSGGVVSFSLLPGSYYSYF